MVQKKPTLIKKTRNKIRYSIIIPMKKISDYFRTAIPYYERLTYKNFELIILPNADGTNEFKNIENVQIINTGKVSPAIKRNIGAKHARGEILAFIDDDAYPEKDWLKNAERVFDNINVIGIGGPGVLPKGATFFQKLSNKVYALSSKFTGIRYEKGKKREIDDWPTCNFLVRKKEFDNTGGFDSKYWGGEDTQICYSLIKSGKKIIYDPEVLVYHHPRASLRNHLRQVLFWGMWRGFFMKLYPQNSRKLTFFMPLLFLSGLVIGGILSLIFKPISYIYMTLLGIYVLFLIITGIRSRSSKMFLPVILLTFITQIMYAVGMIRGLFAGEDGPTRDGMHSKEKLVTEKPK
ncbi:glycosyltransferase [Candidatus Pacearchaeota archaeon]|nr:glycosyltransferase [Candidatus Pacearchaeota archaeon]